MAKGKYLKKPHVSAKSPRKEHQRKKSQKYKMSKQYREQINAIIGAGFIVLGGLYGTLAGSLPVEASSDQPVPEQTNFKELYTIGIANENAEITVDGKNYKIDDSSFVIVSEDTALAYDESGNLLKGYISDDDFKEVIKMTEEEMANYNIYQVAVGNGVNVRSSEEILDNNIISTVPYLDYVLGYTTNTSTNDVEWVSTLSVNGDNIYDGYIRGDLIRDVGTFDTIEGKVEENTSTIEYIMIVDTSRDGNIGLNLRAQPDTSTKENILAKIPDGATVHILGQTITSGDREWTQIEYETPNGQKLQGWVAKNYLISNIEEQQIAQTQENVKEINTNSTGKVTGIDISGISPNILRQILQNGIPEEVTTTYGDVNTSQIAGEINFVYIKLGASPYGKGEFKPLNYNEYEEQVKVCEEFGIPYGFYYYSTSKTVEEANIELECIEQKIESLRQKIDMKNNKLEIVVDVELAGTNDRQYKGDIKEQTEAKATLINGIQEKGLSDNVLIYGPNRVMSSNSDQIINLQYLHSILSNSDNVALWLCSPYSTNGNPNKNLENDIAYAEEQGFSVAVCQVVLDGTVIGKIDINNMNSEHFDKLLNYEKSQSEVIKDQENDGR